MLSTAIFIRNDIRLIDSIIKLDKNTNLKYVILNDKKIIPEIRSQAENLNIDITNHEYFLKEIQNGAIVNLDYIFSLYYQYKLEDLILSCPTVGSINFHPAPLPKYKGVGNYSRCIMEGLDYWGVSAHFMDEKFDSGEVIKVNKFKVDSEKETYQSLEDRTHQKMKILFNKVLSHILSDTLDELLKQQKQNNEHGEYLSKKDIKEMKKVDMDDSACLINLKIRAFWSPPHNGATIEIDGQKFTLINKFILNKLK